MRVRWGQLHPAPVNFGQWVHIPFLGLILLSDILSDFLLPPAGGGAVLEANITFLVVLLLLLLLAQSDLIGVLI